MSESFDGLNQAMTDFIQTYRESSRDRSRQLELLESIKQTLAEVRRTLADERRKRVAADAEIVRLHAVVEILEGEMRDLADRNKNLVNENETMSGVMRMAGERMVENDRILFSALAAVEEEIDAAADASLPHEGALVDFPMRANAA